MQAEYLSTSFTTVFNFAFTEKNCKTCTNSMWLEHTNPNTLKIQDLHPLQVYIFMYQFHHNLISDDLLEPNYFTMNNEVHNYNTRGATKIRVGFVNTCLAYNTIRIQGALLWNTIPTSLKNAPSITGYFLLFTISRLYLSFTFICITRILTWYCIYCTFISFFSLSIWLRVCRHL